MQVYKTPIREYKFLLEDFLKLNNNKILIDRSLEIDDLLIILEEASKMCEETLLPLNTVGDNEGCIFDNGKVIAPKGFKEAYKVFSENGWQGIKVKEKYGGQNLPYIMNMFLDEMVSSTNMSFGLYPGLTANAIDAIEKSATDELKQIYLPHLTSGKWTGTMNLTEPQCGTDLGLSKTMATPDDDGSYNITGTKIFITCGEHDLSENVIHLVLARTPNAPEGIKGISLFLVPKILPRKDGTLDKENNVKCGSIEKKMGIKASPTCVMHYEDAKGWLVGDLNKGMKAMFIMMNGARLFVGIQGIGLSETAFQSALHYSKERVQGKLPDSENEADPIIVHPEIRKNLMFMKSMNDGIRGLMLKAGHAFDIIESDQNEELTKSSDNLIALLTPILKSFATDKSMEITNQALQIYGGHGYITDHGMEQLVRDARITPIYEGTNGIQALDLIGRKFNIHNGLIINQYLNEINKFLEDNKDNKKLHKFIKLFDPSYNDLKESIKFIKEISLNNTQEINSHAVDLLNLFALVAVGFTWLEFINVSITKTEDQDDDFYLAKIQLGEFYLTKVILETQKFKNNIISSGKLYNEFQDKYFEVGI
ncbi:acyl-CoA dehydrogenase family protein [Alphaproteobacteria bacterium]|nr:acyl-CoA dehydrogenase family protein [Alphaproteobacteria bacterium]